MDLRWVISSIISTSLYCSVGALCGMTTTLFGSLFSLPRTLYAMATDGLLFGFLGRVNARTQVPIVNLTISGFLSALLALLFDLQHLVEFMSIGTFLAYTIVSASIIVLRYRPEKVLSPMSTTSTSSNLTSPPTEGADSSSDGRSLASAESEVPFKFLSKNFIWFIQDLKCFPFFLMLPLSSFPFPSPPHSSYTSPSTHFPLYSLPPLHTSPSTHSTSLLASSIPIIFSSYFPSLPSVPLPSFHLLPLHLFHLNPSSFISLLSIPLTLFFLISFSYYPSIPLFLLILPDFPLYTSSTSPYLTSPTPPPLGYPHFPCVPSSHLCSLFLAIFSLTCPNV